MRILLLSQEYPPETASGGIGTYTYHLAHALASRGHAVHVLSSALPRQASYAYQQGPVHVHRIRRWKFEVPLIRRALATWFIRTKHQLEYAWGIRPAIQRLVREHGIDLIEGPEVWAEGYFYQLGRSVPLVVKSHGPLFLLRRLNHFQPSLDWRIVDHFDREWFVRADKRAAPSRALAQLMAAQYQLDPASISVIPHVVNLAAYPPRTIPLADSKRVLYVGRLEPLKGIYTLVDAMGEVLRAEPQAEFIFIGADTEPNGRSCRAELQQRLRAQGIEDRAHFLGFLSADQVLHWIGSSRVLALPSFWESYPNIVLEAMACGTPIVASCVGGIPEMLQDGCSGLLVPSGDASALAGALLRLLRDPNLGIELAAQARRDIQARNSSEMVTAQVIQLYASTVSAWHTRKGGRA